MCGIAGAISRDGAPADIGAVERMCDAMVHRGPDDVGLVVSGPLALGLRRLSIIDPAGGHQPMCTEDQSLVVAFNGEIYNHRELRRQLESHGHRFRTHADTECLLHGYRQWGDAFLDHLNGMFAIALWDEPRQRLLLARDRLGIKPMYVSVTDRHVRFASQLTAIVADGSTPRKLDHGAVSYFLRYGYVAAPRTLLTSVDKLPPAHVLLVEGNHVSCRRYWQLEFAMAATTSNHCAERLREGLPDSVHRQLAADVPVGAFLSGGMDSSSIVGAMAGVGTAPVRTYSVGFAGPDAGHDERRDAEAVADWYGTVHEHAVVTSQSATLIEKLVRYLDEPLSDSSFVLTYLVSRLASGSVKVVLSGVGGDELFGGYRRYLGPSLAPWVRSLPGPLRHGLRSVVGRLPVDRESFLSNYARLGAGLLRSHHLDPFEQYDETVRLMDEKTMNCLLREPAELSALDEARRQVWNRGGDGGTLHQMMRLDMETSLPESLLLLTDRMTMAASIEGRVPLLDHTLVEAVARMPAAAKIAGGRLRRVQKQAMRGLLPSRVLRKRKRGFGLPIGAWFRGDLRDFVRDVLAPARVERQGLFNPAAVEGLLSAHMARRADYSDALLGLLTLSLWSDQLKVSR
jgi:asparagine synthase (glutamine-hydrolysing)